jgi:hypothetical protein
MVSGYMIDCIDAIDCGNNGGEYDNATSTCKIGDCIDDVTGEDVGDCGTVAGAEVECPEGSTCVELEDNCHVRELCNEDVGLCFDPPGPATSPRLCNKANKTECTVEFNGCASP